MRIKLKNGTEVDLHDEDMKMIAEMYKDQFDPDKLEKYFHDMWKKAHMNLEMISDYTIETEKDLKDALSKVIKYGDEDEVSDFIIEAIECKVSKMIIESMEK